MMPSNWCFECGFEHAYGQHGPNGPRPEAAASAGQPTQSELDGQAYVVVVKALERERELSDQLAAALKRHCKTDDEFFAGPLKYLPCSCDACEQARAALAQHAAA